APASPSSSSPTRPTWRRAAPAPSACATARSCATPSLTFEKCRELLRAIRAARVATSRESLRGRCDETRATKPGSRGALLMVNLDRWREIWDTLVQNKLRTVLTMLAMSWGIFMLVALLGLGNGLQNGVTHGFADDAVNSVWIWGGQTSKAHQGMPI